MGIVHRWSFESAVDELLSNEVAEKKTPVAGKVNVALIFPAPYSVGISNLGFQTVHRLLGEIPDVGVERFFFPMIEGKDHPSPFYSFETRRPLGDFDVLAFSLSFEGDLDRLPHIFGPLGIPIPRKKRKRHSPLLIAGGAAVGANPSALSGIFDILVPGEAEIVLKPMFDRLMEFGLDAGSCADLDGVWVPGVNPVFVPAREHHDVANQPAYSHLVTPRNVFGGAHLIEVMRGCPRKCSFCLARNLYHPPRPVPVKSVESWISTRGHVRELGLIAPSLFDHPGIDELLEMLVSKGIRIRNSSVKWEKLSDRTLRILYESGARSLTMAPETGSTRLRSSMGKPLLDQEFYDTIERILAHGFDQIKLYFMIGLPGEEIHDLDLTVKLIETVQDLAKGRLKSIVSSFAGFVPKKGTPWENRECLEAGELKRRMQYLREEIGSIAGSVKTLFESPRQIVRQAYLSRVGPELAEELEIEGEKWRGRGKKIEKSDLSWDV